MTQYSEKGFRKKPKKQLTPLQQNRLLKLMLLLCAATIVWLLFSPNVGVFKLIHLRSKAAELERQTSDLVRTNEELQAEIDRLKNDETYLEQVAREKYGMLKKTERVFDFSSTGRNQKDEEH